MKPLGKIFKSYRKAAVYAAQRGAVISGPGWGFKVTPKQRRRLQKTHAHDMKILMRGAC